jgi:hypothetical protein
MTGFYSDLIKLKKGNTALWNGEFGGKMIKVKTNKDNKVFAFYREKDKNRVIVLLNLTRKGVTFKPVFKDLDGEYTEYFTQEKLSVPQKTNLDLGPWGYKVFVK